jgi:two-component system, cell cycle response regulator
MDILEEIKDRLSIFKNLYDTIRIVDPINKKVIVSDDSNNKVSIEKCYALWKRDSFCDNCISMRAYIELDTILKIEYSIDKILLIIATPMTHDGITYVVELIKEIDNEAVIPEDDLNSKQISQLIYEINEKAIKDEMTGVYNRRYINERLPIDINNHFLNNQSLSIIMADIDFFKKVNDNYGHVHGDLVLKEFVNLLLNNIRDNIDWVGRFGGEEFLIILSNTNLEDAFDAAERIRIEVENHVFLPEEIAIHITASFGVTEIKGVNLSVEEAVSIVDKKLYQAKLSGRNRTCKDSQYI